MGSFMLGAVAFYGGVVVNELPFVAARARCSCLLAAGACKKSIQLPKMCRVSRNFQALDRFDSISDIQTLKRMLLSHCC